MSKTYSREQFVRIISALLMIGTIFGFNITDQGLTQDQIVDAMVTTVAVVSIIGDGIGYILRYFKGDVTLGGFHK